MKLINPSLANAKTKSIVLAGLLISLFVFPFLFTFFELQHHDSRALLIPATFLGALYYSFSLVVGFYQLREGFLMHLTRVPVLGHILYFILLLFLSVYVGFFILPYWVTIKVVRSTT